jgi:hypothetical protein
MADNVELPGTGAVVATDDIGSGVQAQYVKLLDGTSGEDTPIAGDANGLDVDVTRLPAGTNTIGATRDAGPAWTVTHTYTTSADMTTAAALTAAPTAGQKIVLDDILISSDTTMLFELEMETSANVLAAVRLTANSPMQITFRDGLKGDAADKKVFGDASVAGNVYITAAYHSEA